MGKVNDLVFPPSSSSASCFVFVLFWKAFILLTKRHRTSADPNLFFIVVFVVCRAEMELLSQATNGGFSRKKKGKRTGVGLPGGRSDGSLKKKKSGRDPC